MAKPAGVTATQFSGGFARVQERLRSRSVATAAPVACEIELADIKATPGNLLGQRKAPA